MIRRIVVCTAILLVVAVGSWGVWNAFQVAGIPREAYASDWTAAFIIDHIRTTGTWPNGWEDLRDEYDRLAVPQHYAWTFEELQQLIDVNWDTSVETIRGATLPPDNIRLTSGRQVSYNGDPNTLIHDYVITGNDPHQIRERIGELRKP